MKNPKKNKWVKYSKSTLKLNPDMVLAQYESLIEREFQYIENFIEDIEKTPLTIIFPKDAKIEEGKTTIKLKDLTIEHKRNLFDFMPPDAGQTKSSIGIELLLKLMGKHWALGILKEKRKALEELFEECPFWNGNNTPPCPSNKLISYWGRIQKQI